MADDLKQVIEDSFEEALAAFAKQSGVDLKELKTISIRLGYRSLYDSFKEIYCKGMSECGRIAYINNKEPRDIQRAIDDFRENL